MVFDWSDWRKFFSQLSEYPLWCAGHPREAMEDKADILLAYVQQYSSASRAVQRVVFDMWTTPQYQAELMVPERVRKLSSVQWDYEHDHLVDYGAVMALADFLAKPPAFGQLVSMAGELALVSYTVRYKVPHGA